MRKIMMCAGIFAVVSVASADDNIIRIEDAEGRVVFTNTATKATVTPENPDRSVYKWRDRSGRVVYGNHSIAPRGAKPVVVVSARQIAEPNGSASGNEASTGSADGESAKTSSAYQDSGYKYSDREVPAMPAGGSPMAATPQASAVVRADTASRRSPDVVSARTADQSTELTTAPGERQFYAGSVATPVASNAETSRAPRFSPDDDFSPGMLSRLESRYGPWPILIIAAILLLALLGLAVVLQKLLLAPWQRNTMKDQPQREIFR